MPTKEEYQAQMDAQLKEITGKLAELRVKADEASASAKTKYQEEIKALQGKLHEAQNRLQKLKASGGDAWETLRDGTEKAWGELRGAFDNALKKLR